MNKISPNSLPSDWPFHGPKLGRRRRGRQDATFSAWLSRQFDEFITGQPAAVWVFIIAVIALIALYPAAFSLGGEQ